MILSLGQRLVTQPVERLQGEYVYGEVSWQLLDQLSKRLPMWSIQTMTDLGCGYSKVVWYFSLIHQVKSYGIEYHSYYIRISRWLQSLFQIPNCTIQEGDFLKDQLPESSCYFMAGTCFSESTIQKLLSRLIQIAPMAYICSVTVPLKHPQVTLVDEVTGYTSWGKDSVYIYQLKGCES